MGNGKLDITGVESRDYMRRLGGPGRRREEDGLVSQKLLVRKLALYFHWMKKKKTQKLERQS